MEGPAAGKIVPQIAPTLLGEEDLQRVYGWVDEIQLSRPKKNISRDFSDGVLFAEIVCAFFPRLVEMHNFSAANSASTKMYNWNTLNQKVLRKLGYQIHPQDIDDVVRCTPGAVERVLRMLQEKIVQAQRNGLPRQGGGPIAGESVLDRMEKRANERAEAHRQRQGGAGSEGGTPTPNESRGTISVPMRDNTPTRSRNGQQDRQAQQRRFQQEVDVEMLGEKEQKISELTEMIDIMSEKIRKLEQLVRIKDSKIEALSKKMEKAGLA